MMLPFFLAQAQAPTPPQIRDIAPPIDIFPYPPWVIYTAAGLAVAVLGLLVWLTVRWCNRRPVAPPPTPRQIALAALEKARMQIRSLDPYAFSILVSDILRQYISTQFQLHATQQTSPEFLAAIAGFPGFSNEEKKQLAEFLEKCDLIKFARIDSKTEDSERLLEQAIRFATGGAQ